MLCGQITLDTYRQSLHSCCERHALRLYVEGISRFIGSTGYRGVVGSQDRFCACLSRRCMWANVARRRTHSASQCWADHVLFAKLPEHFDLSYLYSGVVSWVHVIRCTHLWARLWFSPCTLCMSAYSTKILVSLGRQLDHSRWVLCCHCWLYSNFFVLTIFQALLLLLPSRHSTLL